MVLVVMLKMFDDYEFLLRNVRYDPKFMRNFLSINIFYDLS